MGWRGGGGGGLSHPAEMGRGRVPINPCQRQQRVTREGRRDSPHPLTSEMNDAETAPAYQT